MAFRNREAKLAYHRAYDQRRTQDSFVQRLKADIGRCERCGYNRHLGSLSWHHVFPHLKSGKDLRKMKPIEAARELFYCLLLCENCHREAHAGLWNPVALRAMIA